MQSGQPSRVGFGVVVQESDVLSARGGNPLVISRAETEVSSVTDYFRAEFESKVGGSVRGSIVDHDRFERLDRLAPQRFQARGQERPAVPVDDDDRDQLLMLTAWDDIGWEYAFATFSEVTPYSLL
jgi:hypothetical protein